MVQSYLCYIAILKTLQTISKKVELKAVKLLILAVNASVKTWEEILLANFLPAFELISHSNYEERPYVFYKLIIQINYLRMFSLKLEYAYEIQYEFDQIDLESYIIGQR